jgi:hypothetical protein
MKAHYCCKDTLFKNILKTGKKPAFWLILPCGLYFCPTFLHHHNLDNKYGKYPKLTRQGVLHSLHLDVFVLFHGTSSDAVFPQRCD